MLGRRQGWGLVISQISYDEAVTFDRRVLGNHFKLAFVGYLMVANRVLSCFRWQINQV